MNQSSSSDRLEFYETYRSRMNRRILDDGNHLGIRRFFGLDTAAYRDGALDGRTKELLGLTASMVLRCQECIDYHIIRCVECDFSNDEIVDAMNVSLVVGGSIVIPHLRRAVETLDLVRERTTNRDS